MPSPAFEFEYEVGHSPPLKPVLTVPPRRPAPAACLDGAGAGAVGVVELSPAEAVHVGTCAVKPPVNRY